MDLPAPGSFCVRHLLLAALLCTGGGRLASAQDTGVVAVTRGSAGISGVVTDSSGHPLADIEVSVSAGSARTRSGALGSFFLSGLDAGWATLSARRLGFKVFSQQVRLVERVNLRVNIRLMSSPEVLEAVAVIAPRQAYDSRLAGFNARSALKVGHFVTRARIDRANSTNLTDMLREIPGVKIGGMRNEGRAIRLRNSDCAPLVFVDGFPATAGEFDVDMIDLQSVEGIEVYAGLGSIPAEFSGPRDLDRCGVIAIWSRPSRDRRVARDTRPVAVQPTVPRTEPFTVDEVDVIARLDTGTKGPTYPDSLYRASVGGRVVVEFVVDAQGLVELATFDVMASSHPLFTQAVHDALAEARFRPAAQGGRKVRQFVQMPFSFTPDAPKQAKP